MGLGTPVHRGRPGPWGALSVQGGKLASLDTAATPLHDPGPGFGNPGGEFFDFDRQMERLGILAEGQGPTGKGTASSTRGSVTASPGGAWGYGHCGLHPGRPFGDATTLYTKAVIDGIVVMVLASVYGKGVLFSALPVGVLQGPSPCAPGCWPRCSASR